MSPHLVPSRDVFDPFQSASTSQLPPAVDRPARVDGRLDDAERGHSLARLAAGRTSQSRPRARHGGPRARCADRHVLAHRRSDRRRARPASPDAVHPDGDGDVGRPVVVGRLCRREERLADLCARRHRRGVRHVRQPGAAGVDADARADGGPAQCHQSQRDHVSDGGGRRPRSRRRADR